MHRGCYNTINFWIFLIFYFQCSKDMSKLRIEKSFDHTEQSYLSHKIVMWLAIDCMGKIELLQFAFFASRTEEKFGYKTNSCSEMAYFFLFFHSIMFRLWSKVLSYTNTIKGESVQVDENALGGGTEGWWWWLTEIDNTILIFIFFLIPTLPSDRPHKHP